MHPYRSFIVLCILPLVLLSVAIAPCPGADAPAASEAPHKLESHGTIQILAWMGPPAKEQQLREMADAGFTISFGASADIAAVKEGLDAAQKAGVKLLVSCPQLKDDPEGSARQLHAHPALAGYFLTDEPSAASFAELARWVRRMKEADPDHYSYINLFPNYATAEQLGVPTYARYVEEFLTTVPVQFLSFDHYPVVQSGAQATLRTQWYENLELASVAARRAHVPLWAFVLSTRHFNYPTPTLAHLRVQAFSDLAYGAQTIEYFTYWQVGGNQPPFSDAPVGLDGKPTVVYDRVKQVNQEIRGLSGVFSGSQVISVGHTGDAIPAGTKRYEPRAPIAQLKTSGASGAGAVASLLANGRQRFLVLVNRDINAPLHVSITLDDSRQAREVARVQKDGTLHPLQERKFEADLEPGDVAVLKWDVQ